MIGMHVSPMATGQEVVTKIHCVNCTRPEPRSYEVKTQSCSILRRNRHQFRPANTGQVVNSSEDEPAITKSDDPVY